MHFEDSITNNFAKLLNQFYLAIDVKNYQDYDDYHKKLSVKFKLDNKFDHYIIESCIYLLEDTEQAINNFEEYGLEGPTKYRNTDEAYLRLYGFLNAVSLQKSVPIQLMEVFKLPGKKELITKLNDLPIIDFRHKAASHSVDYNRKMGGNNYFRIVQTSLTGKGERVAIVGKAAIQFKNNKNIL